jgi:hypothetical protein
MKVLRFCSIAVTTSCAAVLQLSRVAVKQFLTAQLQNGTT